MATKSLRIAAWNANGVTNHIQEIIVFLKLNKIDILLISESHATELTAIKIPYHSVYFANHPDGTAHGGSAIIIKNSICHTELESYVTNKIQAALVKIQTFEWPITISSIYSPPRHTISTEEYTNFLSTIPSPFVVAGDWNAKHTMWGSRIITPKGRNLLRTIQNKSLSFLSTGQPTYWPTDLNKIPDLLDFAITKGISLLHSKIESNLDLSSDHSVLIITVSTDVIQNQPIPKLCSRKTNWAMFQEILNTSLNLNIRLKEPADIEEAVQYLTTTLQDAAWIATPMDDISHPEVNNIPLYIKELVQEKRRARGRWQRNRNIQDKRELNRLTRRLRAALNRSRNETFKQYIAKLSPNDHTIWKATKKFKRPVVAIPPIRKPDGSWARTDEEKANLFAEYLEEVFTPFPAYNNINDEEIHSYIEAPCQLSPPMKLFTPKEVLDHIKTINSFKAPGYDLIVGEILKHLTRKALVLLTVIYNSILRLCHVPIQWKYAQIIMVPKPGKPPTQQTSYRPISLLPIMSKIFERLLLTRIKDNTTLEHLIPEHQFGFREKHSTVQQCHRIVHTIMESLDEKKLCTAVFLDVQQAFDKVWHTGLLYKLKKNLPDQLYLILKSYLHHRFFQVKQSNSLSNYHPISSGVPQGSVLGPFLYLIYTADVPVTEETTMATFADDTAILSIHKDPITASKNLQNHLNILQSWLRKWRIMVNSNKSSHVTFTTRRAVCPQVRINNDFIPTKTEVKYLGLHLDQQLTWRAHIKAKKQQVSLKLNQMNWLIGRKSQLTIANKILLYKTILVPIWTYGIELWGCAKPSNTKILQTFQSKTLRLITDCPWYVSNQTLHEDLEVPLVSEVIRTRATTYKNRNLNHQNTLIKELSQTHELRRLKKNWPEDLPD